MPKNPMNELKFKRTGLLAEAEKALKAGDKTNYEAKMAEVKELNAEIDALQELEAERGRYSASEEPELASLAEARAEKQREEEVTRTVDSIRATKEYARAFRHALKNGIGPTNPDSKVTPLMDALTEAGGAPAGSEGGFLVPIDIDNRINELRRHMLSLADLVQVENVTTLSGWRVKDTAPTKGFTKLSGELTEIPADDQPMFAKVDYTVDTYGLYIPMSLQLVEDEDADLMGYLARWFAKKSVITENLLILELLAKAAPVTALAAGKEIAGLKTAVNKTLDPAISINAKWLANQTGFDRIDALEDKNGRPLLTPIPMEETAMKLLGRRIVMASDAVMPGSPAPIYVGDFAQYLTLFRRKALEVESTRVGGEAWRKYGLEVRGIMRMAASIFDDKAVAALTIAAVAGP